MRKHTNSGGWECLRCLFHKITANHIKALSHVAKVKLLVVNVSLCVAKILDYRLARYRSLPNKNRGNTSSKKRAQEQVNQYINELQETGSKVLSTKTYQKSSSSSWSFTPVPLQHSHSPFRTLFPEKNPRPPTRH